MQIPAFSLRKPVRALVSAGALSAALSAAPAVLLAACAPCGPRTRKTQAANPCVAKNPCAAKHPCAGKGGCGAKHPCAAKNPCASRNPCAASNPCAAAKLNPCVLKAIQRPAHYRPYQGQQADLVAEGKALFADTKLSSNGLSCQSCHVGGGAYQASFAQPYPHPVAMASENGFEAIHADEMVQLCMVKPMAAQPLAWDSKALAALTAYVL
ncbi:MAG TPA: hypothetical protein PLQ67_09495, partial [Burkholderiaceae bacterium]|nr:hypothetical protein [Burkholderiaceae bacterium]